MTALFIAAWLATATPGFAWGPTGHRVGGKLAEAWLTPATRKRISAIIGTESLAQASMHQPLHVGNGKDRGGTRVAVKLMGRSSNLHTVWDSGMIKQRELSYSEWAQWLGREISEQELRLWSEPDPLVWIGESASLREEIYPQVKSLRWDYLYAHMLSVQLRLKQSGVRLAAYLNWLWE